MSGLPRRFGESANSLSCAAGRPIDIGPVLRQNLVRAENGLIPGGNDLHTTRELNQKAFLIA